MTDDKKCKQTLDDGTPCGAWALKEKDFCFSHDPESREAKLLAVRKGGLAREIEVETPLMRVSVATPKDVVTLLAQTINEVREGTLDPRIANTIGYLTGHLIRAFEVAELDGKTEEIRAVLLDRRPIKKGH
mgnify:CR=1 FL=1